jgi:flagellar motor switch protein FliN
MNKMGDMLSQAEIDALLNGTPSIYTSTEVEDRSEVLNSQEIDALGELGNISMGTSATTLFTLLGQKVMITTPKVSISTWNEMSKDYPFPFVAVKVEYTHGLIGSNLMIMKEHDVKVITDLMMGGDGSNLAGELSDLHLSAISEAMNQMVGSSSTSMSSMFDKRIDISPPKAFLMEFGKGEMPIDIEGSEKVVKIAFKMIVGNLIDSEIMQIIPISFAKSLVENLLNMDTGNGTYTIPDLPKRQPEPPRQEPKYQQTQPPQPPQTQNRQMNQPAPSYNQDYGYEPPMQHTGGDNRHYREPVNVQPAQFQSFDESRIILERKNISLIMDVPLQVTVELGRTQKLIKDILEFGPGSIIELDKLAGEPVDILVNGKPIAKGEVVVIDESFGVRITDIIHPSKRL